jgi:hypothetical protein
LNTSETKTVKLSHASELAFEILFTQPFINFPIFEETWGVVVLDPARSLVEGHFDVSETRVTCLPAIQAPLGRDSTRGSSTIWSGVFRARCQVCVWSWKGGMPQRPLAESPPSSPPSWLHSHVFRAARSFVQERIQEEGRVNNVRTWKKKNTLLGSGGEPFRLQQTTIGPGR